MTLALERGLLTLL